MRLGQPNFVSESVNNESTVLWPTQPSNLTKRQQANISSACPKILWPTYDNLPHADTIDTTVRHLQANNFQETLLDTRVSMNSVSPHTTIVHPPGPACPSVAAGTSATTLLQPLTFNKVGLMSTLGPQTTAISSGKLAYTAPTCTTDCGKLESCDRVRSPNSSQTLTAGSAPVSTSVGTPIATSSVQVSAQPVVIVRKFQKPKPY